MSTSIQSRSASASSTRTALRGVEVLVGCYLALSILTIVAAVILRADPALVNTAVWIRGSIVAVTAALMFRFALGAAAGSARHYLRLRIVSAIMVVAIAVILIALPGDFPVWMRIEQAACGLLLVAVVVLANRGRTRALFARAAHQPDDAAVH